jgi:hypothetical protein
MKKERFVMHWNRVMSVLAIAACGVLLTGGGVAAATSASAIGASLGAQAAGAAAAHSTGAAPASGGAVRFTAYTNDDLPGATVVLTGVIGDFGSAVSVLPNGTIDPEHTSEFNLALTKGSFRILIGPLHAKLVQAFTHFKPNRKTCSGHVAATGAAPVVAGSGTGAYKGISGSFKLTITVNEVDGQSSCHNGASVLLAQALFITGSGTVAF